MERPQPSTAKSVADDLRQLGVRPGDVLIVHASTRSLGYVVGGVQAVVQGLLDALGPDGTLVVPTHTSDNSDPAGWVNPPVPREWWPVIREQTPGFDVHRTPSRWMGVIAEMVRTWPGARRSDHPQVSFAAVGSQAAAVTDAHQLDDALGEHSPLGAVYRLDGKVLMLGSGYDTNTSLHLGEWRQAAPPRTAEGASVLRPDGTSHWVTWTDAEGDTDDFAQLGAAFEAAAGVSADGTPAGSVAVGPVAAATARLMSQRALVDFATTWFAAHRAAA